MIAINPKNKLLVACASTSDNQLCKIHNIKLSRRGNDHVKIFFCAKCFPELKTLECY